MTQVLTRRDTVTGVMIIKNDRGLHTRPSTEIVKTASMFNCEIWLNYQKMDVNAKSMLGVLMLAAHRGARVRITAMGEDAEEAVETLTALAENKFYISY